MFLQVLTFDSTKKIGQAINPALISARDGYFPSGQVVFFSAMNDRVELKQTYSMNPVHKFCDDILIHATLDGNARPL